MPVLISTVKFAELYHFGVYNVSQSHLSAIHATWNKQKAIKYILFGVCFERLMSNHIPIRLPSQVINHTNSQNVAFQCMPVSEYIHYSIPLPAVSWPHIARPLKPAKRKSQKEKKNCRRGRRGRRARRWTVEKAACKNH